MLDLVCSNCGVSGAYVESSVNYEFDSTYVLCYNCGSTIKIQCELLIKRNPTFELPKFDIGQLVIINNRDHPWHNEIGIIRSKKFKHYRVELHGQLIWLPENWVESNEPHDIN